MEFLNQLYKVRGRLSREIVRDYLLLLAPLAPFTTEELWDRLVEKSSIHNQPWAEAKAIGVREGKWTIVIPVNCRFRDKIGIRGETSRDEGAHGAHLNEQ